MVSYTLPGVVRLGLRFGGFLLWWQVWEARVPPRRGPRQLWIPTSTVWRTTRNRGLDVLNWPWTNHRYSFHWVLLTVIKRQDDEILDRETEDVICPFCVNQLLENRFFTSESLKELQLWKSDVSDQTKSLLLHYKSQFSSKLADFIQPSTLDVTPCTLTATVQIPDNLSPGKAHQVQMTLKFQTAWKSWKSTNSTPRYASNPEIDFSFFFICMFNRNCWWWN